MNEYPLDIHAVVSWFGSKQTELRDAGVTLAEIKHNTAHLPSARADFDTGLAIGRISVWVSGEVDFEVLRRSDAAYVSFNHLSISDLGDTSLSPAYDQFIWDMANPDKAFARRAAILNNAR
jgi:hypothetical protein